MPVLNIGGDVDDWNLKLFVQGQYLINGFWSAYWCQIWSPPLISIVLTNATGAVSSHMCCTIILRSWSSYNCAIAHGTLLWFGWYHFRCGVPLCGPALKHAIWAESRPISLPCSSMDFRASPRDGLRKEPPAALRFRTHSAPNNHTSSPFSLRASYWSFPRSVNKSYISYDDSLAIPSWCSG